MANGPKIKVEANLDLSSFESELNKLKTQIASVGDQLKTATGRTELNFGDSQKILNDLVRQYDKLTASSNKSDLSSKKHLDTLKQLQKVLTEGAKVSSKVESIGDRNSRTSEFFNDRAASVGQEINDRVFETDRARTQAKIETDRQATNARWANHAASLVSFASGTMIGGGGGYAAAGSGIGGLLGSAFGLPGKLIGSALGGALGGAAASTLPGNKEEALRYSEIRRSMGGITVDFENLRSSVRGLSEGLGVTNLEAATLAKQFAKTANLTSDHNNDIAKSVANAAGLAQGYGIDSKQTTDFYASLRLMGVGKSASDERRIAVGIGEQVARANSSGQFGEVLGSIKDFVTKSSFQTMSTADVGTFTSMLTSLVGSPYIGLKGNVGGASSILDQANQGVLNVGAGDTASANQWLQAHVSAIPGTRATDSYLLQSAGLIGDVGAPIAPGSPTYKNMSDSEKKHADELHASWVAAGSPNNLDMILAQAKKMSTVNGQQDSYIENQYLQKTLGLKTPQQAAVIKEFGLNHAAQGELAKHLRTAGIDPDHMDLSKLPGYSAVYAGSEEDKKGYYNSIKPGLSKEDQAIGDKLISAGGKPVEDFLLKMIDKGITEPGIEAQKKQNDLSNRMADSLTSLVQLETIAKETLISILRFLDPNNRALRNLENGNVDKYGHEAYKAGEVDSYIDKINNSNDPVIKAKLGELELARIKKFGGNGFPADAIQRIKDAVAGVGSADTGKTQDAPNKGTTDDIATYPEVSGGNHRKMSPEEIKKIAIDEAHKQGVPVSQVLALMDVESSGGRNLTGPLITKGSRKGDRAFGPFQYTGKTSEAEGFDRYDIYQNIKNGVSDLAENYKRFKSYGLADAAHHAGAASIVNGQMPGTSDGNMTTRDYANKIQRIAQGYHDRGLDQMPEDAQKPTQNSALVKHSHDVNITLRDPKGNELARPYTINTVVNAPKTAGARS